MKSLFLYWSNVGKFSKSVELMDNSGGEWEDCKIVIWKSLEKIGKDWKRLENIGKDWKNWTR